jgi:hypothetical protein
MFVGLIDVDCLFFLVERLGQNPNEWVVHVGTSGSILKKGGDD